MHVIVLLTHKACTIKFSLILVHIQEVLYGSPLQRLELSIKAMHTNLGVAPVLNSCAVVEGRGQEELLTYLLKLKERSDELERVGQGISTECGDEKMGRIQVFVNHETFGIYHS